MTLQMLVTLVGGFGMGAGFMGAADFLIFRTKKPEGYDQFIEQIKLINEYRVETQRMYNAMKLMGDHLSRHYREPKMGDPQYWLEMARNRYEYVRPTDKNNY